jgi:endoglucanase
MGYETVRTLTACALLAAAVSTTASAQSTNTVGSGYWHTSGNQIIDSGGNVVRIAGINWYGFETADFLAHGLWAQDYKTVLNNIKTLGYNVIRMPFSNQMVESNPVPTNFTSNANGVAANTALVGATALQDMDTIIAYAGSIGLRVILDNHRSDAGNSNEANGLWFTSAFPQSNWIADWQAMATRYSAAKFTFNGNPTVIGMDLRNEPHLLANGAATGACWTGDSQSNGCPTSSPQNWPVAAQLAGNAILAINPKLLIFVEGNDCYNTVCGWQGGNLMGVATNPVVLGVPNQLVYSPHDYGPVLFVQKWENANTTPASLDSIWTQYWAYISANGTAPIWIGEFGTGNGATDIQSTAAGSEGQWFQSLTSFIKANPALSWSYWAANGEDSFSLLDSNYEATPASALKQSILAAMQFPLGGGNGTPPPPPTPSFTLTPSAASLSVAASGTATDTVTVADSGGFTGPVTLSASGMPTGVTVTFATNPATSSSVATVSAGSTAAAGSFTLTISGKGTSAAGTALTASTTVTVSVGGTVVTPPPGACHIGYTITNQWTPGFQVALSIDNTSTTAINGWTLGWTFPSGQTVTQLWNGAETRSGSTVTVKNLNYNASIPAGGSYKDAGFTGTWSGTNGVPTAFTLNGATCTVN